MKCRDNSDTVFSEIMRKNVEMAKPCRKIAKKGHLLSRGSELLVKVHTMAHLESRSGLASLLLGPIVSIVLGPVSPRNVLPNSGVFPLVLDVLAVS